MRSVLRGDSALPVPFYSSPLSLEHFSRAFLLTPCLSRDRKYPWKVDTWGEALLSQCSHHSGGEQEGPEEWWAHTERAGQDEAGTKASPDQWTIDCGNLEQVPLQYSGTRRLRKCAGLKHFMRFSLWGSIWIINAHIMTFKWRRVALGTSEYIKFTNP